MNGSNGHGGFSAGAEVTASRPVVLVRYRPGVTGETARAVHVVPILTNGHADAVSALCGADLMLDDIETVTPCEGMPCTVCFVNHITATPPTGEPPADSADVAAGGSAYQEWDWPVTCHRDQVRLSLHRNVSALAIPIPLSTEIAQILTARRCTPPVLAHPYTPDHHIMLTGERYGVTLPWPGQVHQSHPRRAVNSTSPTSKLPVTSVTSSSRRRRSGATLRRPWGEVDWVSRVRGRRR